jgi:ribosome-binding protein aMBF1 (putative translation factor)
MRVSRYLCECEGQGDVVSFKRRSDRPDPVDQHIGGRLRLRRSQSGMTQAELGAKIGLSVEAVQKYETGDSHISSSQLCQLAHILDISLPYFFEDLPEIDSGGASG